MKVITFSNNKTVLFKDTVLDFKDQCHRWGNCFDLITGEPFEYTERPATEQEMEEENFRLQQINDEFEEITEYNNRVSRGNERLLKAWNHNQFMNAYL